MRGAWLGVLSGCVLVVVIGCHPNMQYADEAQSALGRQTEHNPAAVAMESYKGQTLCPVSGEKLDSMGSPVPVTVKGEVIYVCCSSCVEKVKAEPDKYLALVKEDRAKSGVFKLDDIQEVPVVPASLNPSALEMYNGQIHCPVTGEMLDPRGKAQYVTVKGETVFVCCGMCAWKVRMHPAPYIARVQEERAANALLMATRRIAAEPSIQRVSGGIQ
jgi:YHS domain-containing protein